MEYHVLMHIFGKTINDFASGFLRRPRITDCYVMSVCVLTLSVIADHYHLLYQYFSYWHACSHRYPGS